MYDCTTILHDVTSCGEALDPPWGECLPDRGTVAFGFEQGKCNCFNGGDPDLGCALTCEGEQDCDPREGKQGRGPAWIPAGCAWSSPPPCQSSSPAPSSSVMSLFPFSLQTAIVIISSASSSIISRKLINFRGLEIAMQL